jgi:hypothetical protein
MELLSWHKLQFYLLNAVVSLVWRAVFFFQLFILLAGLTLGVLREYRSFPESNFSYFQEGRTSQLNPNGFGLNLARDTDTTKRCQQKR